MKKLMFAVLATAIMGGIVVYGPQLSKQFNSVTVEQRTVVEEKEVEVDNISKRVEASQQAALADVEAKARAEYDAMFNAEMARIKAQVLKEIEDEIKAERIEVENEVLGY